MFDTLFNKLAEIIATRLEANRQANAWSMTVACWHCHKDVPHSHRICGYCGAALHSPRIPLTPHQEQVAEVETQQVTRVPTTTRATRVDPVKHPRLYRYRAYGQLTDTSSTEPLRVSTHQTRQLVKKYAE